MRRNVPLLIAVLLGMSTLAGLLLFPPLAEILLGWGSLLAAIALLFGVFNLFLVHAGRLGAPGGVYSFFLLLSQLTVAGVGLTDGFGITQSGVSALFNLIIFPLEAALGSLLAFFLLFAGFRLLGRQRNRWALLFLLTVLYVLLSQTQLPFGIGDPIAGGVALAYDALAGIIVTGGARGILIGVALGIVTLSLRLLIGLERPYGK